MQKLIQCMYFTTHLERMNECNCLSCFSEQYFTGALKLKSILCWKFDGMPSITVPIFLVINRRLSTRKIPFKRNHLISYIGTFTIWDMHLSYILCWFVKDHHVRMFPNLRGRGLSRDECTSLHYRIEMEETISLWILICDICLLLVVSALTSWQPAELRWGVC